MIYLATFFTHYGALTFKKKLSGMGLVATMMPVPRVLSSSCGTGIRFETDKCVEQVPDENTDKIFIEDRGDYQLVYENRQ